MCAEERPPRQATTRLILWRGEPLTLLVDTPSGGYLVRPIVVDGHGVIIEGLEVIEKALASGDSSEMPPVVRVLSPSELAAIDQRMARLSDTLGVPIR